MIIVVANSYPKYKHWVKNRIAQSNAMTEKNFEYVITNNDVDKVRSLECNEIVFIDQIFFLTIENYCYLMGRIR